MTDSQYNAALTIFFVSYSVFEPLTNVLLKRLRPSIFIPIIMVLWVSPHSATPKGRTILNTRDHIGHLHDVHGLRPQLGWSHGCSSHTIIPTLPYAVLD
jgi:hypothetical protein